MPHIVAPRNIAMLPRTRTFASPLRVGGKGFDICRDPPAPGQHNVGVPDDG